MRKSTGLILVLITLLSGPVLAVEDAPQGRYSMIPTDNGMLRLDTQTGAVSLCTGTDGHWVCRSIADDRLALENEIDRLSNENQRLKAELEQRQKEAKPDVPYEAKPDVTPEVQLEPDALGSWRPSDEDIEEFMTFFEKIMNRFKQFAESMKDDSPKQQP